MSYRRLLSGVGGCKGEFYPPAELTSKNGYETIVKVNICEVVSSPFGVFRSLWLGENLVLAGGLGG